jgi:hypothetical protein
MIFYLVFFGLQPVRLKLEGDFKNRIWVQDQGGVGFQPAGILKYVEELKPGANAEIGPKNIFETTSTLSAH